MDKFIQGYWKALFWSETILDDNCNELGQFEDHYTVEDLDPGDRAKTEKTLQEFFENWSPVWLDAGWDNEQAGHDFALTRNGHGTGFWDRDWDRNDAGEQLTEACKPYGTQNLYLGDNGKICVN